VIFLPDAARAQVERKKVRDYLLNPQHPQNGGKAAFSTAFGFNRFSWSLLGSALAQHPKSHAVAAVSHSVHGVKYEVRCSVQSPDGRNPCITSMWIIEPELPPRLVTAYP
jgi:filamentous hemagglutinin